MNKYSLNKLNIIKNILLVFTVILNTGCMADDPSLQNAAANTPPIPRATPTAEPDPIIMPEGWTEVTITANSARTRISTGAHFTTTRNACGHEAYGGIEFEEWNKFAKSLNAAVQKESYRNEYCVALPDPTPEGMMPPYMDGTVDVKTTEGLTRTIYVLRRDQTGDQICSTIKDAKTSDKMLSAIHKIIAAADKEDCPNGWGSN